MSASWSPSRPACSSGRCSCGVRAASCRGSRPAVFCRRARGVKAPRIFGHGHRGPALSPFGAERPGASGAGPPRGRGGTGCP
jgi:hypothetical protein